MWNGRDPRAEITFDGARFGSIEHWSDGIITRGVMLDVPRHRGVPCVTQDTPIHGWELEDIARSQGVALEPGDALVVYSDGFVDAAPEIGADSARIGNLLEDAITADAMLKRFLSAASPAAARPDDLTVLVLRCRRHERDLDGAEAEPARRWF
jgi:hypothetical protein